MKSITKGILVATIFMLAATTLVSAKPTDPTPTEHLYLYEKNPTTWEIVEDGAWGKMTYKNDWFVFNGHNLVVSEEYILISYCESWSSGCKELGTCVADEYGNVHISGTLTLVNNVYGPTAPGDYKNTNGAKVWLVDLSDYSVSNNGFIAWHPTEYLFESNLI